MTPSPRQPVYSHRSFPLGLLLAALTLVSTGCATNHLPEYLPRVKSAYVVTFGTDAPTVAIGSSHKGDLADAINDISALGASVEASKKLNQAVDPQRLSDTMSDSFRAKLTNSLGTQMVPSASQAHDSRIEITVTDYGIEASSMSAPLYYFFDVDVRMVYVPENKLIWEHGQTIHEPLSDEHVVLPGHLGLVGTGMNLQNLSELQDEEIRAVFDGLAAYTGEVLVAHIMRDSVE